MKTRHVACLFVFAFLVFKLAHAEPEEGYYVFFTSERDGMVDTNSDDRSELASEIYRMNPDGSDQKRLTENNYAEFSLARMPGTNALVYVVDEKGDTEIIKIDFDGSEERLVDDVENSEYSPSFNADSTRMAYACNPNNETSDGAFSQDIWVKDTGGDERKAVQKTRDFEFGPAMSPDGNNVVYIRSKQRGGRYFSGPMELYSIDLESGKEALISAERSDNYYSPAFSPDGNYFAVAIIRNADTSIQLFSWPDGSIASKFDIPANYCPNFKFSADSTSLFIKCTSSPGGIYKMDIADGFKTSKVIKTGGLIGDIDVSPDGNTVFFSYMEDYIDNMDLETIVSLMLGYGAPKLDTQKMEIYRIEADGTGMTRLTDNDLEEWNVAVVPIIKENEEISLSGEDDSEESQDESEEDE